MEYVYCLTVLVAAGVHFYAVKMAREQGAWDGAFNHHIPWVRQAMLDYDRNRAIKILKAEGLWHDEPNPGAVEEALR